MRHFIFALSILLTTLCASLFSATPASAYQTTQPASQCIARRDYPAGTNNYPYNFARFYNTCNVLVDVFVVGSNNATDYGDALTQNNFIVMQNNAYPGAPLLPTETFACVAPGRPTKIGAVWQAGVHWGSSWPSYGDRSYECQVVH